MNISCIVLAGGKGLRLGKDKVLEIVGSKCLLEHVISSISPLCQDIIIVIAAKQTVPQSVSHPKLRVAVDILPDRGPLGGIYTGLLTSDTFYNLVVACDMPFLNQDLLLYLLQSAVNFDIAIPRRNNQVEPLHAVYTKNCLAPIEDMIKQDRLSVNKLLGSVKTRYVEAEELDRFDPGHLSFFNINTEADLKKARELVKGDSKD